MSASGPSSRSLLHGLTDAEYLWEPVAGCWSVRPSGDGWEFDVLYPEPTPPPLTTIAWLLGHMTQVVALFVPAIQGREMTDGDWPKTTGIASEAVAEWDRVTAEAPAALTGATDDDLDRRYKVPWAKEAVRVSQLAWIMLLHEVVHHGAEIGRMRHLYRNRETLTAP